MTFVHCRNRLNFCNSETFLAANSNVLNRSLPASPLIIKQNHYNTDLSDLYPIPLIDRSIRQELPADLPPYRPKIKILGKIGQRQTTSLENYKQDLNPRDLRSYSDNTDTKDNNADKTSFTYMYSKKITFAVTSDEVSS